MRRCRASGRGIAGTTSPTSFSAGFRPPGARKYMFIHFKFISKSGEVLGNVECNTGDLEPGQTETMNCLSNGKYTEKYDKLTAEATFWSV